MDQAAEDIQVNPKQAWSLIGNVAGWKPRRHTGYQPLKDAVTGELHVDSKEVGRIWCEHFALLYSDHTSNSKNPLKWQDKYGVCPRDRRHAMKRLTWIWMKMQ